MSFRLHFLNAQTSKLALGLEVTRPVMGCPKICVKKATGDLYVPVASAGISRTILAFASLVTPPSTSRK